jgi:hypothetical protein
VCLFLLVSLSAAPLPGQTIGPSRLYDALPDAAEQEQMDSLYIERPPIALGWNWGGALRTANEDLNSNFHHIGYPFRWIDQADHRPKDVNRSFPDNTVMAMSPSWNIPRAAYWDPTSTASQQASHFPWYALAAI